MKSLVLAAIAAVFVFAGAPEALAQQGTMMPLPNYSSNYRSSLTRGYWFTAPTDFRIVGIRVPNDTGNDPQVFQVMRFSGQPSGTNHQSLAYQRGISGNTITTVNISVSQGDVIGILGARGTSTMNNAYAPGGYSTTILGQSTTLYRLYYQSNLYNQQAGSCNSGGTGSIARVEMWYVAPGPEMTITATAGSRATVYSNATGNGGGGVELGKFELGNGATGGDATITEIELTASGTGNDFEDYSEVAIYRDDNGNGSYDAGTDVELGKVTGFTQDDGTATIPVTAGEQMWTSNATKTLFIVGKFNGMASPGDTFDIEVSDLSAQQTISIANASQVTIMGAEIVPPDLYVDDKSATTVMDVILGSSGNVLQKFEIRYPAGPDNTVDEIDVECFGSGDDAADIDRMALYRDANGDGMLTVGTDIEVSTSTFQQDNGSLTFMVSPNEQSFVQGTTRTYFIAADFGLTASDGDTYQTRVTDVRGMSAGTNVSSVPAPSSFAAGVSMLANGLQVSVNNAGPRQIIDNGGSGDTGYGQLMLDFTLETLNAGWTVNSLTFSASGTADDSLAYSTLTLYEDDNGNGLFDDPTTDMPAGAAGTSFAMNDGDWTVNLNDTNVPSRSTRRFFLVAELSGAPQPGETLSINLTDAMGTPPTGGTLIDFPTTNGRVNEVGPARFDVVLNGPGTALTVNNDSTGVGGNGEMLIDVTLFAANANYTVDSITIRASGSADDSTGYALMTLFEDANGNGTFDGAGQEALAVDQPVNAFPSDNGDYVAMLSDTAFPSGTVRRFFLMVRLSGMANGGERFQASVIDVDVEANGSDFPESGTPTSSTPGLIVDTPVLTVSQAIDNPISTGIEGGQAVEHLLAKWSLDGANGDIILRGFTLTTDGNGNWVSDLDPVKGIEVYLDDGNGDYDSSMDELLYSGPGRNGRLAMSFANPPQLTNGMRADIFLVINVTAGAGESTAKTYRASIAREIDVSLNTGARAVFGNPAPESSELTVVNFAVDSFTPLRTEDASGGEAIVIEGEGFATPVSVTIGGVPVDGTAVVNNEGTRISGILVPKGKGANLEIVLTTGILGSRTLPFTFTYGDGLNGDGVGSGGRCSLSSGSDQWPLIALLSLASLMLALRMTRRIS